MTTNHEHAEDALTTEQVAAKLYESERIMNPDERFRHAIAVSEMRWVPAPAAKVPEGEALSEDEARFIMRECATEAGHPRHHSLESLAFGPWMIKAMQLAFGAGRLAPEGDAKATDALRLRGAIEKIRALRDSHARDTGECGYNNCDFLAAWDDALAILDAALADAGGAR